MNTPKKEFSFDWTIENYSFIPLLYGKCDSPEFTPQGFGGTSWVLRLLPDALQQYIGTLYLVRNEDAGPEEYSVNIEISVTTVNGSILYLEECERTFGHLSSHGFKVFVNMNELQAQNTEYLPKDTLVVSCKMWKGERSFQNINQRSARTAIGIEMVSFYHEVENFQTFDEQDKKIVQVPSSSKAEVSFSSSLCLDTVLRLHGIRYPSAIVVETRPSDRNYILCRKKISLIDSSKNSIKCGEVDYRFSGHRAAERKMLEVFTKQSILDNKTEYLPNDQLRLLCEFTFCTGMQSEIEEPTGAGFTIGEHENETVIKSVHPPASENTKKNSECFSAGNIASATQHSTSLNQLPNDDSDKCHAVENRRTTVASETICEIDNKAAEKLGPNSLEDIKMNVNGKCVCSESTEPSNELIVPSNQMADNQTEGTCSNTENFSASPSVPSDKLKASEDKKMIGNDKIEPSKKLVPLSDRADLNKNEGDAEKQHGFPNVASDLRALYNARLLTDIELKTATRSFPAHKLVLCIRSPVFSALLTYNMEVNNTSCLQVDNMEDVILDQFLLFLYSDHVENLRWESAIQLYRAGHKYNIQTLNELCSTFLVNNFSTSTATEVLVLADDHKDTELKHSIENFILAHDKEVFSSEEWIQLSQTNPHLTNKTMLLKYCGVQRGN